MVSKKSNKKLIYNQEAKTESNLKKQISNSSQINDKHKNNKIVVNEIIKHNDNNPALKSKYKKSKLTDFDEKVSDLLKRINNGIDSSNKIISDEDCN